MEDVKVKVNNEAESKEAQELFFELGYGWHGKGKKLSYSEKILGYGFGWLVLWKPDYLVNKVIQIGTGFESVKEITIDQLRDMVVLKRNDCNDRTHVDSNNYDWYVASDEKHYRFQGSIWVHQPYVDCLELKPIKKDQSEKEYLDENFNLVYGDGFYIIPDGSTFASGDDFGNMVFRKDGFYFEKGEWKKTETTLDNSVSLGLNIVWQRSNKCADTPQENDHYYINVSDVDEIDFYEIALRYNVTDPCIQHILKKCLAVGNRGHKDFHTDLKDIAKTANRMLVIHGVN